MLAKVRSCAVIGLEGALVGVEVDIGQGLSAFSIVGLPDAAVYEAKERVRAAIKNSGAVFPLRRITVNLALADLRKAGRAYDLPIAVAILLASGQVAAPSATGDVAAVEDALFLGELSLDGGLRHTHGILPMVALARERGASAVYVPMMDAREASLVEEVTVYPVGRLSQLLAIFALVVLISPGLNALGIPVPYIPTQPAQGAENTPCSLPLLRVKCYWYVCQIPRHLPQPTASTLARLLNQAGTAE